MSTTRRQFLAHAAGSSTAIALASSLPRLWLAAAEQSASNQDRVLVVIQLSGGNDGLNTVVPYADDVYQSSRPELKIGADAVLKIDDYHGLHPALKGFSQLLESRRLAIVQGVGYPNPNRSHFESMDIWHTALPKVGSPPTGWLGRYMDAASGDAERRDAPALHLGPEKQPLALASLRAPAISAQSLERFRLELAGQKQVGETIAAATAAARENADDLISFLQSNTASALATSQRVSEALGEYKTATAYPSSDLAQKLKSIAQLITSGMRTKIYYVMLDGFDTHSAQPLAHAGLLTQLGDALKAFVDDLAEKQTLDRVLVMTFSEFGRRVKENASRGTDHGAAAPLFLAGSRVAPGLIGKHPSLTDLDDGDCKFHTDFRQVYATLIDGWLGGASREILGAEYTPVAVLA